jgi:hypothetical protein
MSGQEHSHRPRVILPEPPFTRIPPPISFGHLKNCAGELEVVMPRDGVNQPP